MDDTLERRIEALERAITDGEADLSALADDAAALERLEATEETVEELEETVGELEAATQALRGYVGNIRSVNQHVEQRADTALAKVEALETAGTTERHTSKEINHHPRDETQCRHCGQRQPAETGEMASEKSEAFTDSVRGSPDSVRKPGCNTREPAVTQATESDDGGWAIGVDPADEAIPESNEPNGSGTGGPLERIRELV